MDYIKVEFSPTDETKNEMIIASLIPLGFEGFEETATSVLAYIPAGQYKNEDVKGISDRFDTAFKTEIVKQTNWNAEWESGFQPVCIDDFAGIRAEFHPDIKNVEYEIIITPKMSFGTGHHATTYMMIAQMKGIDFKGMKVFDFGTGTGVLAILAAMLGSASVLASDYDQWSIENSHENILRNEVSGITTVLSDKVPEGKFNVILANINKNVITENFDNLVAALSTGGTLLLSGLLISDAPDIMKLADRSHLLLEKRQERNNWLSLRFKH